MNLQELLREAVEAGASDVHLSVGCAPVFRINGTLKVKVNFPVLQREDTLSFVKEIVPESQFPHLEKNGELDFAYDINNLGRFRINVFKQRGTFSVVFRYIKNKIPTLEELNLPPVLAEFTKLDKGLVLITGPTGSGKSTTLASMVERINMTRNCHIITLEDPIEYLHQHKKSIINQREIGIDSQSFAAALRAALRQDPDVIMVGEMRDLETIATALIAAETGHLVLATLHTGSAVQTIQRIINVFPPHQQQQIRVQLADTIQGIVSQQLLTCQDGSGRIAAVEVLVATPAIRNLIRENKDHQILSCLQTGTKYGMQTMDMALKTLYEKGIISREEAYRKSSSPISFKLMLDK